MHIKLLIITLTAFAFSSIEEINTQIDDIVQSYQTETKLALTVFRQF
jgi:hypothetical protein